MGLNAVAEEPAQIKYCIDHWSQLMWALKDAGLEKHIAQSPEELNQKLQREESDACFTAQNTIIRQAIETFGIPEILKHGGCPVCPFTTVIQQTVTNTAKEFD